MELVVVLGNIRSVHNVGSIFRTADGAGFRRVVLCGITPSPTDRFDRVRSDFAKVSLGAEENVSWERMDGVAGAVGSLRGDGFTVIAVEQSPKSFRHDEIPSELIAGGRVALVLGEEVGGIPEETLALCDGVLELPMLGVKKSLNVSVAFGVAAYALVTAIGKQKTPR